MRRLIKRADFGQFLPLLATVSILSGSISLADEPFPNELNSTVNEPQVILLETPNKVPVRAASREIQQSTDPLVQLVYKTREVQRQRLLSTSDHTPWQMMHGLLGLRQDFVINHNGQTVNGLEWIQTGPLYNNEPWFQKTQFGGQAHPFNKPYWFEGHINQFLAILSMCNVPLDAKFGTPQGPITMRDMLKNAQMTANEKEEVTWTLWALSTYLPPDAEWINAKGERWSIERLVQLEVAKRVGGPTSPCGGTHGLFALARARNVYLRTGKPLRGVWQEADLKIQRYIQTAKNLQNANGTLSSSFFKGKEYKQDFDKRMASCGHVLEFLMISLPQERLNEPWVRRAIEATANDLMANRKAYVSCSPLYHATDALSIYLERMVPASTPAVAQQPLNTKTISNSKELKNSEASANAPAMAGTPLPVVTPETSAVPATAQSAGPPKIVPDVPAAIAGEMPVPNQNAATPAMPTVEPQKPVVGESTPKPDAEKPSVAGPGATEVTNPIIMIPLPDPTGDIPSPAPALVPTPESLPESEAPKAEKPATEVPAKVPDVEPKLTVAAPVDQPLAVPSPAPGTSVGSKTELSPSPISERVASASSRTVVASKPSVIVSGEQMETKAGLAEAVGPMLPPVPLLNSIPSTKSFIPETVSSVVPAPKLEVRTASNPIVNSLPNAMTTALASKVLPSSNVGELALPQSSHEKKGSSPEQSAKTPGENRPTEKTPTEKKPGEWKSTPLERRKPLVVEESPSV